jgi:hypothetical protein
MIVEPNLGVPSPASATDSSQRWDLGARVKAKDYQTGTSNYGQAQFIYCQGNNVGTIGAVVKIINYSAVMGGTVNSNSFGFPVGVAAGLLSATNCYGWVQVEGLCDYARGINWEWVPGVALYFTNTAGVLVPAAASLAGNQILGMGAPVSYLTAGGNTKATVQLNNPIQLNTGSI